MRVVHEERWSQTESSLQSDEVGTKFLKFYRFWFDAAETMLDERQARADWEDDNRQPSTTVALTPVEAMRRALMLAEEELGFITVDWVGQMLCVASMHWEHGKLMAEGMTPIEVRVMETSLAAKIAQLQEEAASGE